MGLFRGAVFDHGSVPENCPLASMGRFPSLMGRFPTLMGRFPRMPSRAVFPLENPLKNSPLRKGHQEVLDFQSVLSLLIRGGVERLRKLSSGQRLRRLEPARRNSRLGELRVGASVRQKISREYRNLAWPCVWRRRAQKRKALNPDMRVSLPKRNHPLNPFLFWDFLALMFTYCQQRPHLIVPKKGPIRGLHVNRPSLCSG